MSRLLLVLLLPVLLVSAKDPKDTCVYTVYIRTGGIIKAGTDSKISLTLGDATGASITVSDIEAQWGLMGPTYDYFERSNLDVFSGRGPCLSPPLCRLNVTSDGAGAHHGWYCEYVEVTATGPHVPCRQTLFYVRQWLALDAPPYELSAVVEGCGEVVGKEGMGKVVLGRDRGVAEV